MPRRELERALGVALAAFAALIAITCAARGRFEEARPELGDLGTGAPAASLETTTGPQATVSNVPASALPSPDTETGGGAGTLQLPRLFADLRGLAEHTRKAPVRICWFGDSHTAADYLTGALRSRLAARFGAGGPGFVRVGVKSYRHSQVRLASDGPWRIEPPGPARRSPFDDGVFGLSGMRAFPAGGPASASFEVSRDSARGQLDWQVWFSLAQGASFRVELSHTSRVVTAQSAENARSDGAPSLLSLGSALSDDTLRLTTLHGAPRFYGLTVEGSEPGVVLDAIGIDGARLATTLAWNEASFQAGIRLRAPSLVALAFGTNEAFDGEKVASYGAQYRAFLARVRLAMPSVDCLIVGPPDANATSGGSEPRVAQIDTLERAVASELGCGYVSQLEIMGGPGGYTRWQNRSPALARGDRLHLTPKGYESVASVIADRLLVGYGLRVSAAQPSH